MRRLRNEYKYKNHFYGLGSPLKGKGWNHFSRLLSFILSCVCTLSIYSSPVFANPEGGQITSGAVTIQQTPTTTTINQSSEKAIINWQSFNIGAQESTHFQQPAGGVALNRISPNQGVSQIYGHLTATGQIILINPAGIYFGPSAFVNVGGLIASTADITDQHFLNGNYHFSQVSPYSGSIINQGTIIAADHGLVALIGNNVQNNGLIQANLGHIVLASGNAFTMTFAGNELISFSVDEKSLNDSGVSNTGTLRADGGQILVTAKSAAGVLDNVINMEGVAQAQSVDMKNGEIILYADAGVVKVAAKIDASGKQIGEKGGKVKITSQRVLIDSPTVIDVSGDAGGGEILIGGNYQGKGPLPNARATVASANTDLIADAITTGKGGDVILWSDELTKFQGNISAKGGASGGDGGFVETSSKDYLEVMGVVDASAALGTAGTWLLDPANVIITAVTANGGFNGGNPNIFTTTANTATVNVTTINASLNGGTSVTILTTPGGTQAGTITVTNAILKSAGLTTPTLTLNAVSSITINNTISATSGGLNVTLIGDALVANSAITTNGGNFLSTTQNATTLANAINTGSGTVAINVNQDGAGANNFLMNAGSSIATTNTSSSAVAINVNAAAGGTGTAALRSITTGSGGTITVATNAGGNATGGSITMPAGTLNVGTGSIALTTSAAATRAIGTAALNIQMIAGNLTSSTGSGGTFITNTGTSGFNLGGNVVTGGGFTLTSLGSSGITDSGTLIAPGTLTIAAGTIQDITLNSVSNNFGTVAISSGRNVILNETNDLILGNSTVSGDMNVTTGGALTDSGNLIVNGNNGLTVTTMGGVVLNSLSNQIAKFNVTNSSGGNVQLTSIVPLTITGFSQSGGGTVTFIDTGTLTIANGVSINSSNAALAITATDLNLSATGELNSGSANTTITQNTAGGSIGLVNTPGTMSMSGSELQRITANNLTLNAPSNGQIIVDGVTPANGANITTTVTLNATAGTLGSINFVNNASTFRRLAANADNGITVGVDLTTTVGNLALNANVVPGSTNPLTLNANLTAAGSITLNASSGGILLGAPVKLTGNGVTLNQAVTGPQNLIIDARAGTARFNKMVSVANLTVDAGVIAINGGEGITTTGNQTYNAFIDLGASATFTGQNITFNDDVTGGGQSLILIGQPGDNNFTFNNDIGLANLTVTGSATGNNSLTVNTGSTENWTITGNNQGALTSSGISGNFSFSQIQNLTGGSAGNHFAFSDGASISGLIDGVNTASAVNTLDYSLYSTPIKVLLANLLYSGDTQNNMAAFITHFANINNLTGSEASALQLSNTATTLTFNSANSGSVTGPLNFSRFNSFVTLNSADQVVFVAPGIYDLSTNLLRINGTLVPMTGFNPNNFSGNISFINSPISPTSVASIVTEPSVTNVPTPSVVNILMPFVASILTPFNNLPIFAKNNVIPDVLVTNNAGIGSSGPITVGARSLGGVGATIMDLGTASVEAGAAAANVGTVIAESSLASKKYVANTQTLINLASMSNFTYLIFALLVTSLVIVLVRRETKKAKDLSFKIRTELNTIIGFSSLLGNDKSGLLTAEQKEYLNGIIYGSRLISQELAKIEMNDIAILNIQMSFNLHAALMGIKGFGDLLRHGKKKMTLKQEDCLDEIRNGSNGILQLVTI